MANDSVKSGFSFQFESNTPPEAKVDPLAGLDFSFVPEEQRPKKDLAAQAAPGGEIRGQSAPSQSVARAPEPEPEPEPKPEPKPLIVENTLQKPATLARDAVAEPSVNKTQAVTPVALPNNSTITNAELFNDAEASIRNEASPRAPEIRKIQFPQQRILSPINKLATEEKIPQSQAHSAIDKLRNLSSRRGTTITNRSTQATKLSAGLEETRRQVAKQELPDDFGSEVTDLAEPEDLIPALGDAEYHAGGSDLDDRLWENESPQPGAVFSKVKVGWQTATEQANRWTQRGIRAGHHLGRDAVGVLRQQRAESKAQATEGEAKQASFTPSLQRIAQSKSIKTRAFQYGLGPFSAVVACSLVYLGGNLVLDHWGVTPRTPRSVIPDLGSLADDSEASNSPIQDQIPTVAAAIPLSRYQKNSADRETTSSSKTSTTPKRRFRQTRATPSAPPPMKIESTPMPKDLSYPGKGLLEVVTSRRELIYVDGVFVGKGPLRRIPLEPGEHEIRIQNNSSQRGGQLDVVATQRIRAVFAAF